MWKPARLRRSSSQIRQLQAMLLLLLQQLRKLQRICQRQPPCLVQQPRPLQQVRRCRQRKSIQSSSLPALSSRNLRRRLAIATLLLGTCAERLTASLKGKSLSGLKLHEGRAVTFEARSCLEHRVRQIVISAKQGL